MKVLNTIMAWFAPRSRGRKNEAPEWTEIEYFNESWKNRIKTMAMYIAGRSVMDLGSGKEWLREFLSPGIQYVAVDYCDRGTQNLVCDFNQHEFPQNKVDCAFISGCLEYIVDYSWFIKKVASAAKTVIVSYNTTELVPDLSERKLLAWKNHLSERELTELFRAQQMQLQKIDRSIPKNPIFIFQKNAA